jgi:hypothetical protein
VLLAAMGEVEPNEAGRPSGVMNTSFMMGGALGLAVLTSVAASRTEKLEASGHGPLAALTGGYHAAFLIGALFAAGGGLGRRRVPPAEDMPLHEGHETVGVPAVAEADR